MPDRVLHFIDGPRGSALLACAALAFGHALAFWGATDLPPGIAMISRVVPLHVYCLLWLGVGLAATYAAVRRGGLPSSWSARIGFSGIAGMLTVWGFAFLMGWASEMYAPTDDRSQIWWLAGGGALAVGAVVVLARGLNVARRVRNRYYAAGSALLLLASVLAAYGLRDVHGNPTRGWLYGEIYLAVAWLIGEISRPSVWAADRSTKA